MADFDFTEAVSFLGRTALVELRCYGFQETFWCCVRIAGVVFSMPGVYEHSHFMVFSMGAEQRFPDELFWSQIESIIPIDRPSTALAAVR